MRLGIMLWAGLALVLTTSAALAATTTSLEMLGAELRNRQQELQEIGDQDKASRKRGEALAKVLEKLERSDGIKEDIYINLKAARSLPKWWGDDARIAGALAASVTSLAQELRTEADGYGWKVEEGESLSEGRQKKAWKAIEQMLDGVDFLMEEAERSYGLDGSPQSMSIGSGGSLSGVYDRIRDAAKRLKRAAKRLRKLQKWFGEGECPGRLLRPWESIDFQFVSRILDYDFTYDAQGNRASVKETVGPEGPTVRIVVGRCLPGRRPFAVVIELFGTSLSGPLVGTYVADGTTAAEARITVLHGSQVDTIRGRNGTGTIRIDEFDAGTPSLRGRFEFEPVDNDDITSISGAFFLGGDDGTGALPGEIDR